MTQPAASWPMIFHSILMAGEGTIPRESQRWSLVGTRRQWRTFLLQVEQEDEPFLAEKARHRKWKIELRTTGEFVFKSRLTAAGLALGIG